jgi:hypothetical protein
MNSLIKCCIYIKEYYSGIKKNKIMLLADKWIELEIIMLSKVSQVQKDKGHMFSFTCWKIDPKDKHMHKTKHDHVHIYTNIYTYIYTYIYIYTHTHIYM